MNKIKVLKYKEYDLRLPEVQAILQEIYNKDPQAVVIAWREGGVIEVPLFTEEGLVYDVDKNSQYILQYCKIEYVPSDYYLGDNDPGVYNPKNNNIEDKNIKCPPGGGYYTIKTIENGDYGIKNKNHATKRLAAYNKWFKTLKWVEKQEKKGGEMSEAMKYIKRIFNEI